jgi:hypothetical protein
MCPDRIRNSGVYTAARWVMHLGMIRKLKKHQHYMRRTTCRHVIKYACFTAPQNVHVTCPDRNLISGGYRAVRSVMHLGTIPKWRKHKNYVQSIKLRPLIKCACSTAPQKVQAMCPDRIRKSSDDAAARWLMHLGMIRKLKKILHFPRTINFRPCCDCARLHACKSVYRATMLLMVFILQ